MAELPARAAAKFWQNVIVDVQHPSEPKNSPFSPGLMVSCVESTDGVDGQFAAAEIRKRRPASELPAEVRLRIDGKDANLLGEDRLRTVLLHEFGHLLGFGLLWRKLGLLELVGGVPMYTGSNALNAYRRLAGASVAGIPVEPHEASGIRMSHWSEAVFDSELMTSDPDKGRTPLSGVSIASFEDLGYKVNYAAAEDFVLASSGRRRRK